MQLTDGLEPALGGVLALAAASKVMRPSAAAQALVHFGLRPWRALVFGLALVEAALAAGLVAEWTDAAYAAAGLFLAFALAVALSLRAGRAGAPCPCFGARSRLGSATLRRALALAAVAGAAPTASASVGAAAVVLAAVAVLAAGVPSSVRAALGARRGVGALEIRSEGPPLGSRPELFAPRAHLGPRLELFAPRAQLGPRPELFAPRAQLGPRPELLAEGAPAPSLSLAVFLSDGCPPCDAVASAVRELADHPAVVVRTFDEVAYADVWRALGVPAAPYAVAFDDGGAVRAKGTFNSAMQLESILATAERRSAPRATSRRGFLARTARTVAGAAGAGALLAALRPSEAAAHHFCGHTYTTGSCPHPTGLPRVDRHDRPLRAKDGRPVDDLGRLVDPQGRPVDEQGRLLVDPDGVPLAPAPRSQLCLELVRDRYGMRTHIDGSWHRCCGGHVRKLMDCCSNRGRRINGDGALTGYCAHGRKVFCVFYYQTEIPC